jgi:M6 family metalloprotease-like protein
MKKLFALALIIAGLGSLSAQSFVKHFPESKQLVKNFNGNDSLKILAVMVEFQEDRYDATVGNGKFGSVYTQDYGDTIIDPLPHDAQYFEDHLLFAKNYFRKVSNGKVNISYKVLPEVITVSKYMRDYTPAYNSNDYTPMGNFTKEVWQLADKKFTGVQFKDYDLFIIFHAGVSAGIDLGTFTIDRNMPSLYLSGEALTKIFGNQFKGIPVNNGSAFINNSIIMSETESRESTDITGKVYIDQFSINGFLVSNIGSYLGIPDLQNTITGRSAIGRFGLMDSQGLNANFGMFPPEPSPWEKIYMGWETPVTISNADQRVNIAAKMTAAPGDTTLLKIPINSSEYYLVENRAQDALKNNSIITYKRGGKIYTKVVHPDTSGYYYIMPDSIPGGVVIDVDEFDAATPGNGIVIWHIDDNIINQNIADNKINSGDVKGIYVEEADGIFDIGQIFYSVISSFIDDGRSDDLWFKGNKSKLYKNIFSSDTKPNTKSNSGANTLITLNNFSEAGNKMGFNIQRGGDGFKLHARAKVDLISNQKLVTAANMQGSSKILISDNSNLFIYDLNGNLVNREDNFSSIQPVSFDDNFTSYIIGAKNNFINIYSSAANGILKSIPCEGEVTAISVNILQNKINLIAAVWNSGSYVQSIPLNDLLSINSLDKNNFVIYSGNYKINEISAGQSLLTFLGDENFAEYSNKSQEIPLNGKSVKSILFRSTDGNFVSIILMSDNSFVKYESGKDASSFKINSDTKINSFAAADLLNNGKNYIVIASGNSISAYDLNGILAENFPFVLNTGENFIGTPIVADINNDGTQDIIASTDKGNIYAVDSKKVKLLENFPLSFGDKLAADPVLIAYNLPNAGSVQIYQPMLPLLNEKNDLYVWQIGGSMGRANWLGKFGDLQNSSFIGMPESAQPVSEFFPEDKAYNWPNPVYGNETNIRYFVSENSDVNIKIFDLAGDFVAELNNRATGGFDNETVWNVSSIQSGVYYARIEVKGDSGKSANKIIKIAVIK